jgi:hypothetical protein
MNRNRSKAIFAIAMSVWLMAFTCTAAQWFSLVNALLPLATQIATQFYTFANKGTLSAAETAAIQQYSTDAQTIFGDIGTDVKAWQTNPDPSKLAHINVLLAQLKTQSADLVTKFQISDSNTLNFINALVADAIDLAGLIPIIVTPPAAGAHNTTVEVRMRTSLPKARSLIDVFKHRLANLPK